jgi:long-chain acyl-CoA synthetase
MEKIWLKSYPPGVPDQINADLYTSLGQYFEESVKKFADRKAFISGSTDVALSYRELDEKSRDLAAYFQQILKLPKGSRVAIMMPNLLQYPICAFGLLRAGYVIVNVNPMYTPRELEYQLKDSGADAIIIVEIFAQTLSKIITNTSVKHVVVTGLADMMPTAKRLIANVVIKHVKKAVPTYTLPNSTPFLTALTLGAKETLLPVKVESEDLAFLQYTGGTTGVSKGAMLTHRNLLANIEQIAKWTDIVYDESESLTGVTAIPLYHIYALSNSIGGLKKGGTNVLVADPRDIPGFVKILSKYPFASLPAVNTLFIGLLNDPNFAKVDFSHLRFGTGGGAATQRSVAEQWQQVTGKPLIEGYGLTECSPTVTVNRADATSFRGGIGLPLPSTEVSIRDFAGHEVPIGQPGELCVKGPQVMKGYWNKPKETADVMTTDGFLRTGDMATIDDQGYLTIVDRLKDMILVSGFNVYPSEIEEVVMMHPGVLEVAAIGKKSDKTGEIPKIFVIKKSPDLSEEMLIEHCRDNLVAYKIPREIEFVTELPKTPVGKILRRELRDRA